MGKKKAGRGLRALNERAFLDIRIKQVLEMAENGGMEQPLTKFMGVIFMPDGILFCFGSQFEDGQGQMFQQYMGCRD